MAITSKTVKYYRATIRATKEDFHNMIDTDQVAQFEENYQGYKSAYPRVKFFGGKIYLPYVTNEKEAEKMYTDILTIKQLLKAGLV